MSASAASRLLGQAFSRFSPRQIAHNFALKTPEQQLLLLGGLTYVPASILTPVVTNLQLKKSGIPDEDRRLLVVQEVVRQVVSAGIWFLSYYGGIALFGKAFEGKKAKTLLQFGGAVLAATVGHGLLRPLLTNSLLVKWFYKAPHPPLGKPSREIIGPIPETTATSQPFRQAAPLHYPPVPSYSGLDARTSTPSQIRWRSSQPQPPWNRATAARIPAFQSRRTGSGH